MNARLTLKANRQGPAQKTSARKSDAGQNDQPLMDQAASESDAKHQADPVALAGMQTTVNKHAPHRP